MSEDDSPLILPANGPPSSAETPTELVITITLTPSAHGIQMKVDYPQGTYLDAAIDGCLRAARFLERRALLMEIANAQAQAAKQAGELARILGRRGS